MDHTNPRSDESEINSGGERPVEKELSERATLTELYQYLDGSWYFLVVIGLVSAFI
jgi:hypothetical protein